MSIDRLSYAFRHFAANSKFTGPCRQRLSSALVGNGLGAASIFGLLCSIGPSAVLFSVITVVVDALNRKSWRALSHIRKELLEPNPSRIESDTASAVMRIGRDVWVSTPIENSGPYRIRAGSLAVMPSVTVGNENWRSRLIATPLRTEFALSVFDLCATSKKWLVALQAFARYDRFTHDVNLLNRFANGQSRWDVCASRRLAYFNTEHTAHLPGSQRFVRGKAAA